MDSFWIKIIALAVIIGGLVGFVQYFKGKDISLNVEPEKTFSEVTAEDDARLRAEPEKLVKVEQKPSQTPEQQNTDQPKTQPQLKAQRPERTSDAATAEKEPQTLERQFKEVTLAEEVEAGKLLEYAIADYKKGRLPGMGYKLAVDNCRKIITKFPGTVFDFKARRLLANIPERFHGRYKITPEEMDYESVGVVKK